MEVNQDRAQRLSELVGRLRQREQQHVPIADQLAFQAGRDRYELRQATAQESYQFRKKRLFGLWKQRITPEEAVQARLEGKTLYVEERRTVSGTQVLSVDGHDVKHDPVAVDQDTRRVQIDSDQELEAFCRVNTQSPPQDDLEALAQKLDSLTHGSIDRQAGTYYEVSSGVLAQRRYGGGHYWATEPVSDLEGAHRLREGQAVVLDKMRPIMSWTYGRGWYMTAEHTERVILKSEAELDRFLRGG
ncbi:MAG: hypothetical protein AB1758_21975 [Candidatus Eremiobacterota bacterium]